MIAHCWFLGFKKCTCVHQKDMLLMGNDIGSDLLLKAVCIDFCSTNVRSSVIETGSTTGFDVITLYSLSLILLIKCSGRTEF